MSKNEYQGLILTNHALSRMKERGISKQNIWETYTSPDHEEMGNNHALQKTKKFSKYEISIVYKRNEKNEVIIISAWMEPPLPGSRDAREKEWYLKYKKAGFWGKIWLEIIKQFNL